MINTNFLYYHTPINEFQTHYGFVEKLEPTGFEPGITGLSSNNERLLKTLAYGLSLSLNQNSFSSFQSGSSLLNGKASAYANYLLSSMEEDIANEFFVQMN